MTPGTEFATLHFLCKLQMGQIILSVGPGQAFPALYNVAL
jgi:hypothetical protein